MKERMKALVLIFGLVAAFGLTACGSGSETTSTETTTDEAATDETASTETTADETTSSEGLGYTFESNGVTLSVDMDTAEILDELGEPASTFEEASCAAQGTAYIYTYSGYQITTYPDGDANLIGYITLKDDTVATPEGVDLSSTKDDVIAAYGDATTEGDTQLSYEKDGMTLNFIFDGDSLTSIEYTSSVMN